MRARADGKWKLAMSPNSSSPMLAFQTIHLQDRLTRGRRTKTLSETCCSSSSQKSDSSISAHITRAIEYALEKQRRVLVYAKDLPYSFFHEVPSRINGKDQWILMCEMICDTLIEVWGHSEPKKTLLVPEQNWNSTELISVRAERMSIPNSGNFSCYQD